MPEQEMKMRIADRDATAHLTLQSTILEMIALRGDLDGILERLCILVQEMIPCSVASLMLIDKRTNTLRVRSAPGLPEETRKCFDGLAMSPNSGSCGTAAYTGKMVIVEDTLTDPRWAGLRDLARRIEKYACWSIPVFCSGELVGTFAISLSVPGPPTEDQIELLKTAGHLVGIAITRDRADAELRAAEEALRHAQKLESLGVLAGGIAHDFNNLLTGVLGNAKILLNRIPEDDDAMRRGLNRIVQASNRAADLTNQMLAYSGKAEVSCGVMSLPSLVREVAALLGSSISKRAQLNFDIEPGLPNIEGDTTQMRQLVMNLITNASEALGDNAGKIEVTMRSLARAEIPSAARFLCDVPASDRYVMLAIRDTGLGMDRETLCRIFDPFFSTKFVGRGLGLAAVHGIVRGQAGAILVESRPGDGTTFAIYIPATDKPLVTTADGNPVRWTGDATVLFVDDEPLVTSLATEILEGANLRVIDARDGQEAVDIFRERHEEIDLVVLDLTTPRLTGAEVCEQLRSIRNDVRIVLSSGYVEQDARAGLEGHAIDGFVHKPYTPSELLDAVRESLCLIP